MTPLQTPYFKKTATAVPRKKGTQGGAVQQILKDPESTVHTWFVAAALAEIAAAPRAKSGLGPACAAARAGAAGACPGASGRGAHSCASAAMLHA